MSNRATIRATRAPNGVAGRRASVSVMISGSLKLSVFNIDRFVRD
jgi:hypothetical protein